MTETHGNRTETHACDLIDRQAAIDAIAGQSIYTVEEIYDKCNRYISDDAGWIGGLKDAIDAIKELPSAQQWIPCSECERKCEKWENLKTSQE